jgi:hypothetical protein
LTGKDRKPGEPEFDKENIELVKKSVLNSLELTLDSISLIENPVILTLLSDSEEYKALKALFIEDDVTPKPINSTIQESGKNNIIPEVTNNALPESTEDNGLLSLAQEENIPPPDVLETSNDVL